MNGPDDPAVFEPGKPHSHAFLRQRTVIMGHVIPAVRPDRNLHDAERIAVDDGPRSVLVQVHVARSDVAEMAGLIGRPEGLRVGFCVRRRWQLVALQLQRRPFDGKTLLRRRRTNDDLAEPLLLVLAAGIGLAMTQTLLADGYRVAAFDLSTGNLESLRAAYPNQLEVHACDVSQADQVQAAVEAVIQKWERIDIVVNNAALAIFKRFDERTLEETRRELDVNYFGYVNVIAAVLPHMKANGGIIHNMSSGVGITGFARLPGYTSTKGAIESLTRTLAIEFEPYKIHVNVMHPPLTNTKSASPLGVPAQTLADPAIVGRNLAKKIESTKPVIASDLQTALYLFFAYRHPLFFGRLFSKLAARA